MTSLEIADIFDEWNAGELNSFLIEITADILRKRDDKTGHPLVDLVLDTAGQKGTGRWTSQAAMDLGVPIPTIDSAVTMRQISARKAERVEAAKKFNLRELVVDTGASREGGRRVSIEVVRGALYAASIATYAQGLSLLQTASSEKDYKLDLGEIAKVWRGGCIIRAALLEDIRKAFKADRPLVNLLVADPFLQIVMANKGALMMASSIAAVAQIPAMSFAATYNYVTAYFNDRLPANLIQAQRDYFGAHTYQRIDEEGTFHTPDWGPEPPA
jgi:6-phosphogluconate dehydrogenase